MLSPRISLGTMVRLSVPLALALAGVLASPLPSSADDEPGAAGLFGQTAGLVEVMPEAALVASVDLPEPKAIRHVSEAEMNTLAALAILEAGGNCQVERLDVAQVVFNRLQLGHWGRSVISVAFAPGQFQPFFGVSRSAVDTEAKAASFVAYRWGVSRSQALQAIRNFRRDVADPVKMAAARRFVGGRTSFKGVSQYPHRVPSEDPLRHHGCNFYHIDRGQTYAGLARLEAAGPDCVLVR